MVWLAKDLSTKDHRSVRVNMNLDTAHLVSWSPDSTAFVVSKENEQWLEVYKLGRKEAGSHVTVNHHTTFQRVSVLKNLMSSVLY